jgi:copper homeostasis protein
VQELLKQTGCDQVHASLRSTRFDLSTRSRPQVRFSSSTNLPEDQFHATNEELVGQIRKLLG